MLFPYLIYRRSQNNLPLRDKDNLVQYGFHITD